MPEAGTVAKFERMMQRATTSQQEHESLLATATNRAKLAQAQRAWNQLFDIALRRSFHGTIGVELSVQDGTIQNLRRHLEQLEK